MANPRHAERGPSKYPQYEQCPCFETGPVGAAAKQGTYEHEVLEKMLNGESIQTDDATLDKVGWAYEFVLEMAKNYGVSAKDLQIEEEVHIVDADMNEITYGTLDIAFLEFIFDYKSGEIRNYKPQMACYALGQMQARGLKKVTIFELYGRYKKPVEYELTMEEALVYGI